MLKIDKKRVVSRIETSVRLVVLSMEPFDSPFLFSVVEYSKKIHKIVTIKYFTSIREAENYLFENYVYMIIPSDRLINEGYHVFLY